MSILGEVTPETFLAEYWQKKPLLVRNAFPDFESPVSPDELAGLALEEDVESRLIIADKAYSSWALEHGPFPENRFENLPESHWTLLVQGVDLWVPAVDALIYHFDFLPRWRIDDIMV
ncbi:MAG: cupin domain-containing protein, partial [bacterium]